MFELNQAQIEFTKGRFFRKYNAYFSLPKKCADPDNYPEKEILKLRSV